MKIFVIGFNKCATTTLHHLFLENNLNSQHSIEWDIKGYDCFSDNGNNQDFIYLDNTYPDSIFILNTRKFNKWLISRFDHCIRHNQSWGKPYSKELTIKWIEARNNHYLKVLKYFENNPHKLIILSIEEDNWIEYISNILNFKKFNIRSQNIHDKCKEYKSIINCVNNTFKDINYNNEQEEILLLDNKELNNKYFKLYRNNIISSNNLKIIN